jgi:hypothetical protein
LSVGKKMPKIRYTREGIHFDAEGADYFQLAVTWDDIDLMRAELIKVLRRDAEAMNTLAEGLGHGLTNRWPR